MWMSDQEFLGREKPEVLIEKMLIAGGQLMIFGEENTGKSFLALDMAVALTSDDKWMGFAIKRNVNVGYVAAEAWAVQLERRTAYGKQPRNRLHWILTEVDLGENQERFIAETKAKKIEVVFFDTFHDCGASTEHPKEVVANYQRFAKAGIAIVLVHHSRKPAWGSKEVETVPWGPSVFLRKQDARLFTESAGEEFKITQTKCRFDQKVPKPFFAYIRNDRIYRKA